MDIKPLAKYWLVVGHFGGYNTGDEAMLLGLISGCSPEIRQRLLIMTRTGELSPAFTQYGMRAIPAKFRPLWRAINHSSGIILGGGTHFHDDYLRLRYLRHVRYLVRFLLIFSWARLRGKRVLWLGMGFGPIYRPLTRWLLRWGIVVCDHLTVRDRVSAAELEAFVAPQKLSHAFDLAALMEQETPALRQHPQKIIGISVVDANYSQTGQASQQMDFWTQFTAALINVYLQNPQLQIHVFVIRGGSREDDTQASGGLIDALSQHDPARVRLIPYHDDPALTLACIAECDCFIATRFHAAILSYLAGCRLLFLAYHRKLEDLAHEIDLTPIACINIAEPTTIANLERALLGLIGCSSDYVAGLPVMEARTRARLSIDILDQYAAR